MVWYGMVSKTFADDIGILANDEKCDIIMDDVIYFRE